MVDGFTSYYGGIKTEILPGIWLGDLEDAQGWDGPKVAIHEDPRNLTPNSHWIPIMYGSDPTPETPDEQRFASRNMLDAAASVIRYYQSRQIPVLVHCFAGQERSPLVIAWFLKKYKYTKTINEAYDFIKEKRPQVFDRTCWLERK